jgi:hypothetical protein
MPLRDQLQAVYDKYNQLTPELVVQEAANPASPLHSRFEWDDTVAAEAWRREQAHRLIQRVKVVYREADDKNAAKSVRAFHAVRTEIGHAYEPVEKVARDPFLAQLVMRDMEREWKTLKRRYSDFHEFWSLIRSDLDGTAA